MGYEEQKKGADLAKEARHLQLQAEAAEKMENMEANEPEKAKRLREAAAVAEDPKRQDADVQAAFQRSPAYKMAKEHSRDVLGEVHNEITRMRTVGVYEMDPQDRKDLIMRVGEGVPARMAKKLRETAERMLDTAISTGDIGKVHEVLREGVFEAAHAAPFGFETPDATEYDTAALIANIPRM
jgi:hypothetical protein